MGHEVKVQERGPALVLAKRMPVTLPEIGSVLGAAFGEVYGSVERSGGRTNGPPFVIYHGMPDGETPFDMEVCAPIQGAIDPPAGWEAKTLPGGTFASLLHVGPYDSVGEGYEVLSSWISSNELAFAGPPREVYLSDPTTPPEQIRTVIEFPVFRVAEAIR